MTAQAGAANAKTKVIVKVKGGYGRPAASSAALRAASPAAWPGRYGRGKTAAEVTRCPALTWGSVSQITVSASWLSSPRR